VIEVPRGFNLNIDLNDIQNKGSNKFDIQEALKLARTQLKEYSDLHVEKIRAEFEENKWEFRHKVTGIAVNFDYTYASNILKFSSSKKNKNFTDLIKCWITRELDQKAILTVSIAFFDVLSALYTTNGFSSHLSETFFSLVTTNQYYTMNSYTHIFELTEVSDYSLNIYLRNIESFLGYIDSDFYYEFISRIASIRSKIKVDDHSRELPSYLDVLKFKKYIEYWSESSGDIDEKEWMRFFPVYLWWEVTTIIPMRPSEFCLIRRDCLSKKDNYFYLTFPRLKHHRNKVNRTQDFFDTLPIPENIYNKIDSFIKLSQRYDTTEFLFNFNAFVDATREIQVEYDEGEIFTIRYLFELIAKFYHEIIHNRYHVNIKEITGSFKSILFSNTPERNGLFLAGDRPFEEIEKMIKPGDLRHIAIINMFLQGYDPVEVQRLAGHFSEETQLSYQRHMQFWVDTQIQQLALEFSMHNLQPIHNVSYKETIHPRAIDKYNKLYKRAAFILQEPVEVRPEQDLKIGFCSEEGMPCPSFNWKHAGCYFCPHWRITVHELEQNREKIINDLSILYDELKEKVTFMKALLLTQSDELGQFDVDAKKALTSTSNEIQSGITNISKIMSMIGVS
jgi:hypothetical protein